MDTVHYHCRECYKMHDPCENCWVLIDLGTHPQQPKEQEQNKMTEHRDGKYNTGDRPFTGDCVFNQRNY